MAPEEDKGCIYPAPIAETKEGKQIVAIAEKIDFALKEAQDAIFLLEELQKIPLPRTINQAVTEEWLLEAAIINFGAAESYAVDVRNKDRARAIPMRKAIQIIEDFEDAILENQIVSPKSILGGGWAAIRGIFDFMITNANSIWEIVKLLIYELWKAVVAADPTEILDAIAAMWERFKFTTMAILLGVIGSVIALFLVAANVPAIAGNFRAVTKLAAKACEAARKGALQQGSGPRVYRRKEARL